MLKDKDERLPGKLLEAAGRRQNSMLDMLSDLVRLESPSDSPSAINRAVEWVEARVRDLGGRAIRHPAEDHGDILEAHFGFSGLPDSATESGAAENPFAGMRPVMLLGHLDTVWPMGTLDRMPFRVSGGRAYGPGILDMKAGVVMALEALALLRETDREVPVILLLSSDEEVGSDASRALTEARARACRAVFVLEPAQGEQGAYKTARKGVGQFRLSVSGMAAHSGVDFQAGHSAVLELARQLERVAAVTDLSRGITVNPGVIGGGTRVNVIAAEAWADIDLRVKTQADASVVEEKLRGLTPVDPACRIAVTGGLNRPPMERTEATAALFARAKAFAAEMGFPLEEAATGGGSDGNFTSALGVPTLDGMGAVGNGAHAENESILVESLVPRTALLAAMIATTL